MTEAGFDSEVTEQITVADPVSEEQLDVAKSDEGEELDEQHLILKRLLVAHEAYFNVFENYEYAGRTFPGYAEFYSHGEKYILSKKAKLWAVDAFEYLFFDLVDTFTLDMLNDYIEFLSTKAIEKVHPDPDHMTSYLSLVVVANAAEGEALRKLRHSRFHKDFKFGLQGWADMRLAVVDLSTHKVETNSMGKDMKRLLEANAGFIKPKSKRKFF